MLTHCVAHAVANGSILHYKLVFSCIAHCTTELLMVLHNTIILMQVPFKLSGFCSKVKFSVVLTVLLRVWQTALLSAPYLVY